MMTKKKIQALINNLTEDQTFYRKKIEYIVENAESLGYIVHKCDDIVLLYKPGYESLVGGLLQTSLDHARGKIEGLQLAINYLKKEL